MAIPEKLLKFKFHLIFVILVSLLLFFILLLAPRFFDIIAYFWPLFLSTALFLVAIVVFGQISPPGTETSSDKTGEELLDYVAGQPELVEEPQKSE
ncbi:hypothetical protein HHK36_005807 [Tetracentron sinense]|uniref:Transmembrane protein n=1 Tax=Tetracentron sinense TaxID=13715 RepID=A0A835DMP1_TETSI|nr:hypothetical protein HHK36_005807 [Tetracentron sinense]